MKEQLGDPAPGFATRCIHAGLDPEKDRGAVAPPIYASSTFAMEGPGRRGEYFYSRRGNPTRAALEECLAALEGGVRAFATGSGLAAEATVLHLFDAGTHVIAPKDVYGGTHHLFTHVLARQGFAFTFVDMRNPENVRRAIGPKTRLIWIETPSNPLLHITDIASVCGIARERGITTAADNTFPSPWFQRPLDLGADIVTHSTTKYLNGHGDVVGGAIICKDRRTGDRLAALVTSLGTCCSPFDAWLVRRGIKTLPLRMEAHARNAQAIAEFLQGRPEVERVFYPGLPSHPQHDLARRQMTGFGGVVSFEVKGGREAAFRFVESLRTFTFAVSLGGVESLVEHPASMSHDSMPPAVRAEAGITEGLLRLSVGIEAVQDLIRDLEEAFVRLGRA